MIPPEVQKIADDFCGEPSQVKLETDSLSFEDYVLVPTNEWDFDENPDIAGVINLKEVDMTQILGGPTCTIYKKKNKNQPYYVVIYAPEDNMFYYYTG